MHYPSIYVYIPKKHVNRWPTSVVPKYDNFKNVMKDFLYYFTPYYITLKLNENQVIPMSFFYRKVITWGPTLNVIKVWILSLWMASRPANFYKMFPWFLGSWTGRCPPYFWEESVNAGFPRQTLVISTNKVTFLKF